MRQAGGIKFGKPAGTSRIRRSGIRSWIGARFSRLRPPPHGLEFSSRDDCRPRKGLPPLLFQTEFGAKQSAERVPSVRLVVVQDLAGLEEIHLSGRVLIVGHFDEVIEASPVSCRRSLRQESPRCFEMEHFAIVTPRTRPHPTPLTFLSREKPATWGATSHGFAWACTPRSPPTVGLVPRASEALGWVEIFIFLEIDHARRAVNSRSEISNRRFADFVANRSDERRTTDSCVTCWESQMAPLRRIGSR